MNGSPSPIVIAGGGLAGGLAALAIRARHPDRPLRLVEGSGRLGGNHVWSFFDTDVDAADRWLVEPLTIARWPSHDLRFPKRRRTIAIGYNSLSGEALDAELRRRLAPDEILLGRAITAVDPGGVTLADGSRVEGGLVLDARGADRLDRLDNGWQKFVGRILEFDGPHGVERPVVMDATVEQADGYRFVYCLPFSATRMLVEDTYYSNSPTLDVTLLGKRIEAYCAAQGWPEATLVKEESGVLPVTIGGEFDRLWPQEEPVARIGMRGGFFHPTTGYTLPDAVRTAVLIAGHVQLDSTAMARLLRSRARELWRRRGFYRMLNLMLFRAAEPDQRYRVLEHFYRLPGDLVGRFYAGRATGLDKLRILSGRPPVPLGRAIAALSAVSK